MRSSAILSLAVLGSLCVLDWAWTLLHLARGIPEANPLLAAAFESGGMLGFSVAKLGVTGVALAVLGWQRNHPLARRLMPLAIALYGVVLGVHVAVELTLA